jgi:hypothetical protein
LRHTTFQKSTNDNFIAPSHLVQLGAFRYVHESGLTADEGFVNFDVPAEFSLEAVGIQRKIIPNFDDFC